MSRLPFEVLLALRYLRPKRTFVSVITLICIIGVTLGVAVLIIVISVMTGFDRQLREKILGFNAHLKVFRRNDTLSDYQALIDKLRTHPSVKAVAPMVIGPVLLETQPVAGKPQVFPPWVRGFDPSLESGVSSLPKSIISGKADVSGNGLLVGSELAYMLGLNVGDPVALYSISDLKEMNEQRGQTNEVAILPEDFVVTGIFDVGYYEYNATVIACSLENAQHLYDLEDSVHALLVMVSDPFAADAVRRDLRAALGQEYGISVWFEENSALLNALVVEKHVMFYLLFFIMIVAAFGIASALITFVVQKTREIGILKALGATGAQVMYLFLSQSLMVGLCGVSAGFLLGMLALRYRNGFLLLMNRITGFELFPPSIYNFSELPALIVRSDIMLICGSALVMCLVAGVIPAWNAGRLRPVDALRHE